MPLYIVRKCGASCIFSSNALKSLIIMLGYFLSWWFWGPMNSGFAYDWELRGAARSAPEGRTVQVAALVSRRWARVRGSSFLLLMHRMEHCNVITCGWYLGLLLDAFQLSLQFGSCASSCLSPEYSCKAPYRRISYTQSVIHWIFIQLKLASNSWKTHIIWLI
jgi:hypothetical protein